MRAISINHCHPWVHHTPVSRLRALHRGLIRSQQEQTQTFPLNVGMLLYNPIRFLKHGGQIARFSNRIG
jgi:hypothetical protein